MASTKQVKLNLRLRFSFFYEPLPPATLNFNGSYDVYGRFPLQSRKYSQSANKSFKKTHEYKQTNKPEALYSWQLCSPETQFILILFVTTSLFIGAGIGIWRKSAIKSVSSFYRGTPSKCANASKVQISQHSQVISQF